MFFWQELFAAMMIFFEFGFLFKSLSGFQILFLLLKLFQRSRNDGSENNHRPGREHPDQKDRQDSEGAVKRFVSGIVQNYHTEKAAQQPEKENRNQRPDEGIADFDFLLGTKT